jgi:hypothetical protein
MKHFIAIQLIILLFAGCSSSYHVQQEKNSTDRKSISYAKLNAILKENIAGSTEIVFQNGEECHADGIQIQKDSTYFIECVTDRPQRISTSDIKSIRRIDRVEGIYEGILNGIIIGGGGAGVTMILLLTAGRSESDDMSGAGMAVTYGVLGGVLLGGTIGGICGVHGHTYTYEIVPDSVSDSR